MDLHANYNPRDERFSPIGTTGTRGLIDGGLITVRGPCGQSHTMLAAHAREIGEWLIRASGLDVTEKDGAVGDRTDCGTTTEMAPWSWLIGMSERTQQQQGAQMAQAAVGGVSAAANGLRVPAEHANKPWHWARDGFGKVHCLMRAGCGWYMAGVADWLAEYSPAFHGYHYLGPAKAEVSDPVRGAIMGLPSSPPHVLTRTGAMRQRVSVITALRGRGLELREAHYAVEALAAVSAVLVFLPTGSAESMREDLAGLDVQIETLEAYLGRIGGTETAPSTWQDRLRAELKEVEDRTVKLMRFICSPVDYNALPAADRALLREQHDAMNAYLGVLRRRVARFAEQA